MGMNKPLETFCTVQWCHTGLLCNCIPSKSCKNAERWLWTNYHITREPLGNTMWNQSKVRKNTVSCFCNQEDVTIDTFLFKIIQKASCLTTSWWDHAEIHFSMLIRLLDRCTNSKSALTEKKTWTLEYACTANNVHSVWSGIISIDNSALSLSCLNYLLLALRFQSVVLYFAFGLRLDLHWQDTKCGFTVRM